MATLAEYLEESFLPDRIGLSAGYVEELRRVVRMAGNPDLSALSKRWLADFLRTLKGSPVTINNKRRELLTIWRSAADDGLAPPAQAPRTLSEPRDPPTAWTIE